MPHLPLYRAQYRAALYQPLYHPPDSLRLGAGGGKHVSGTFLQKLQVKTGFQGSKTKTEILKRKNVGKNFPKNSHRKPCKDDIYIKLYKYIYILKNTHVLQQS